MPQPVVVPVSSHTRQRAGAALLLGVLAASAWLEESRSRAQEPTPQAQESSIVDELIDKLGKALDRLA